MIAEDAGVEDPRRPRHRRGRERNRRTVEERTGYRSGDPTFRAPAPRPLAASGRVPEAPACDLCGAPMIERHCKLTCTRCGYQRDCSDP